MSGVGEKLGQPLIFLGLPVYSKLMILFYTFTKALGLGAMQDRGCLGLVHWDTQRNGIGREVGEGFRIGNTCTPVADSC